MSQSTWTIILKVNGETLEARSVKVKLGTPTREPVLAAGVMGRHYTVKPENSQITCIVVHRDGFDLDKWATTENVSVVCISDAGPTYQISGAFVSNSLEISDEGGGVTLELIGPPAVAV